MRADSLSDVRNRLRHETEATAVVLASAEDSLYMVAPAGRAVVAVPPEFSNPYVVASERTWGQRRMLETLTAGDFVTFGRYAAIHRVTHVLLAKEAIARLDALPRLPTGIAQLSRQGDVALLRVEPAELASMSLDQRSDRRRDPTRTAFSTATVQAPQTTSLHPLTAASWTRLGRHAKGLTIFNASNRRSAWRSSE